MIMKIVIEIEFSMPHQPPPGRAMLRTANAATDRACAPAVDVKTCDP